MDIIENVAKLLKYQGPDINELIAEAYAENKKIIVDKIDASTALKITFKTAYETIVTDVFIFNEQKELIKQELHINDKINVIFDKYKEASDMLINLTRDQLAAS